MNRQVILIDRCSLTFMEATVSSKKMAVKAFFRLPIGDAGISDSFEERLRHEMERAHVKPKEATLVLSAPSVIERFIELPKTSNRLLPEVVQLQVEAMPLLKFEDPVCDYTVKNQSSQQTHVGVTISSNAEVERSVVRFADSGFQIASVTSSIQATSHFLDEIRQQSSRVIELFVLASDQRLEVLALHEDQVLASHTELIPDSENESGEKIQRLVIRSITAIQRKYEFYKPSEALLLTDDALLSVELKKKLVEDFGIESEVKDYRTDLQFQFGKRLADDPGKVSAEVAILTGALLGQDQPPQRRVDLLKPKKAKNRWAQFGVLAALAASLLFFLLGQGYLYLRDQQEDVNSRWTDLKLEVDELTAINQKSDRLLQLASVIQDFQGKDVPWLSELEALGQKLPPENEAYLRQLVLQSDVESDFPRVNAIGFAKDQADVMEMNQDLSTVGSAYDLDPRPFFFNERTEPFIHQFELDLRVNSVNRTEEEEDPVLKESVSDSSQQSDPEAPPEIESP